MTWVKAGCAAKIANGECKGMEVEGTDIAVYNVSGRFHATSNICTHQRAFLSEGYLEDEYIECPLHQGRFNVITGDPEGPPVTAPLRVYPVRVEGGELFVNIASESHNNES